MASATSEEGAALGSQGGGKGKEEGEEEEEKEESRRRTRERGGRGKEAIRLSFEAMPIWNLSLQLKLLVGSIG